MRLVINFTTEFVYSNDTDTIDALSMLLSFKLAVHLQHQYCMFEGVNEEIITAIVSDNPRGLLVPVGIFDAIRDYSNSITSWIAVFIDRHFNNLALLITTTFFEDE